MKAEITILQLSDLHLFKNTEEKFLKINPYLHLKMIIDQLLANKDQIFPDLVILTGDISQDYSRESYIIAKQLLDKLAVPIFATLGNHDEPNYFLEIFNSPSQVYRDKYLGNWELVLLNTQVQGEIYGKLSALDLNLLWEQLSVKKYQLFFTHHHFLPTGCRWLDELGIINKDEVFDLLKQKFTTSNFRYVKGFFSGHVHQETYFNYLNTSFFTAPAIGWQFTRLSDNFGLDRRMPGYQWIRLYDQGNFSVVVKRLEYNELFLPDNEVKAY